MKRKHEEITDLIFETADCTDELALKLEDDIGRFGGSIKETYAKLDEIKGNLRNQELETTVRDNGIPNISNADNLSQAKLRRCTIHFKYSMMR